IVVVGAFNPRTRLSLSAIIEAFAKSARDVVSLVAASASVGIIIGIVTLTGIGTRLPATILP
ncbi:MAG TPA: C4-dicarboxylate ABC transporter permease, partial [Acidobacteria bacterium]|nr:C4-dicarboxylate ABC transporter permease [Acidobacteriota bacterium]